MSLDQRKLEELEELKAMTQVEEDFAAIWKFFFDHFGERPEFMSLGERADEEMHEFLEPILESVCRKVISREVMVAQFVLTEVEAAGARFYHGPCLTDAGVAVVFYFDDVKAGMISINPSPDTGMIHYARFSTVPVPDRFSALLDSKSNTSH